MIYYPLQLLQLAGIRDVLLVTGKGHAGQMIDLLGDGRLAPRGGGDPILELDLTYKVQTEPGGIAQVVGMARDFAGGAPLVVVLGDNIFEFAQSSAVLEWADDAQSARIFVKEVEDPENFGVVVYENGMVADIVEKAGVVDTPLRRAPLRGRRRRALLLPARRLRRHRRRSSLRAGASSRSPTSTGTTRSRVASTRGRSRAGGRTPGSTGSTWRTSGAASTRPARTSGTRRDRGHRPDPAPRLRGRARLVLRAAPATAHFPSGCCRRTSSTRAPG